MINEQRFKQKYENRLNELVNGKNIYPGTAVAVLSALNVLGKDIPARLIEAIDFRHLFETNGDAAIIGEALKRYDAEKKTIAIDKTIREQLGPFVFQYNYVRGLRPKRHAKRIDLLFNEPINPKGFNFNSPECDQELFHSENAGKDTIDYLLNRYPFAPFHFLAIPNRKDRKNQYLDPKRDAALIEHAWASVAGGDLGERVRLAYNSLKAHASVNHLHFQGFFTSDDWVLPIDEWLNKEGFPQPDFYFPSARFIPNSPTTTKDLKVFIKEMNKRSKKEKNLSYCLDMSPKGVVCFPRKSQNDPHYLAKLNSSPFTTGYAFYEMLGEIISPTKDLSLFDRKRLVHEARELYRLLELK